MDINKLAYDWIYELDTDMRKVHNAYHNLSICDGMYYEITHNGDKNETYIDVYKKWKNFVVKVED